MHETQKEVSLPQGEALGQLISKPCARGRELIQGHGDSRHSLKLILISPADVFVS